MISRLGFRIGRFAKEIDAETWEITRLEFAPPTSKKFSASIRPDSTPTDQKVNFSLSDMRAQK